ncbi:hypothetical protein NTGBS_230006 [Candidatus Nitrotoga sp. BS]|nr:hypothetical protein NTGBS_230006 [Candidatus Nitrotoga sp. BS]
MWITSTILWPATSFAYSKAQPLYFISADISAFVCYWSSKASSLHADGSEGEAHANLRTPSKVAASAANASPV